MQLSQKAYEQLKRMIVTLELAPGHVIDEATLCRQLELGRTPVREALIRLEHNQLVRIVPRRGMFVADVNIADLPLLYESRAILEKFVAQLAAERGDSNHWLQMERVLSAVVSKGVNATSGELVDADRACHEIMYQAADNKFLTDTLIMLYDQSDRLWHLYLQGITDMFSAIDDHCQIYKALVAQDGDLAGNLIEAHVRKFQSEIQSVILKKFR